MKKVKCSVCSCELAESNQRNYLYCANESCQVHDFLIDYSSAVNRYKIKQEDAGRVVYVAAVSERYEDWELLSAHDDDVDAIRVAKAEAEKREAADCFGSEFYFKSIKLKYKDIH